MKINSNIMATMTVVNLGKANQKATTAMERLSSGLKINSAKDNPAGLAISDKLDKQVRGLKQANQNAMDGISFIQTGEGALNEVHAILGKMKELAIQGKNDTLSYEDVTAINTELVMLTSEVDRICSETEFNGINMLEMGGDLPIQIGSNHGEILTINMDDINYHKIHDLIKGIKDVKDKDVIENIEKAVIKTSDIRSELGAYQNRLEHTVANLGIRTENTTSSLSRILDADMAEEMSNYTQYNVLSQSAIAMLAQANQRPQQVLQLLNS